MTKINNPSKNKLFSNIQSCLDNYFCFFLLKIVMVALVAYLYSGITFIWEIMLVIMLCIGACAFSFLKLYRLWLKTENERLDAIEHCNSLEWEFALTKKKLASLQGKGGFTD